MSDSSQLVDFLVGPGVDQEAATEYVRSLAGAPIDSLEEILRSLMQNLVPIASTQPGVINELLQLLQSNMLRQSRDEATRLDPDLIVAIYENLPNQFDSRFLLLHALSIARSPQHLQVLCDLLVKDPPESWIKTGLILSPLFQHDDWDAGDIFPDAIDAIQNSSVASGLLDLANHLFRNNRCEEHPCSERTDELTQLLIALVARLEKAEKDPNTVGSSAEEVNQVIAESIALIVSTCDVLALCDDHKAKPQLRAAMDLSHRRIQTEAAGALARLGEEEGVERIIALAAEPSARLRVLAYAEELGFEDRIDDQYCTPTSRAESELALWLAQPGQMSVPPTSIKTVDHQLQFWPGFEEPIDCYLFNYGYAFAETTFSNIGIVGPMVHAFSADLSELTKEDTYAAFAGWQAEHDDIYIVEQGNWNSAQRRLSEELEAYLMQDDIKLETPEFIGFFFGEHALVSVASKGGAIGVCVTDGLETIWYPTSSRLRPLSTADAWNIYKGRKLLRTFNP